jgi:hypothetical protein
MQADSTSDRRPLVLDLHPIHGQAHLAAGLPHIGLGSHLAHGVT